MKPDCHGTEYGAEPTVLREKVQAFGGDLGGAIKAHAFAAEANKSAVNQLVLGQVGKVSNHANRAPRHADSLFNTENTFGVSVCKSPQQPELQFSVQLHATPPWPVLLVSTKQYHGAFGAPLVFIRQ